MNLLKRLYQKAFAPLYTRHDALEAKLNWYLDNGRVPKGDSNSEPLPPRVNWRNIALAEITDYLKFSDISGDYLEFGVAQGNSFSHAYRFMARVFPDMRFCAFDSFEGLPKPSGIDVLEDGTMGGFHQGDFACTISQFRENVTRYGVDLSRVHLVEGWYDRSLTTEAAITIGLQQIAAAWIDCDLYESTVPVLRFITPYLVDGSVIYFDDWRCFRNRVDRGQQLACAEWLNANPNISLTMLLSAGWNGVAFTVRRVE